MESYFVLKTHGIHIYQSNVQCWSLWLPNFRGFPQTVKMTYEARWCIDEQTNDLNRIKNDGRELWNHFLWPDQEGRNTQDTLSSSSASQSLIWLPHYLFSIFSVLLYVVSIGRSPYANLRPKRCHWHERPHVRYPWTSGTAKMEPSDLFLFYCGTGPDNSVKFIRRFESLPQTDRRGNWILHIISVFTFMSNGRRHLLQCMLCNFR